MDVRNNGFYNNTTDFSGSGADCLDSIVADPLFADAVNGDFSLLPNSPVMNKANTATDTSGVSEDFAGNSRVVYDTVDMGAYER